MTETISTTPQNPKPALFTEAFRPNKLEQAILIPRIREELSRGLTDNILLYGSPGAGKTTCSRILANLGADSLTINASLERGVDVIRDKVVTYASSCSLFGGEERLKVVVLEECDNLTNDAWMSLRATIEQFHKNVRFIANCNYIDKIPDPIKSRFNCISIDPINQEEEAYLFKEYCERVKLILNACKITFTDEVVEKFVRQGFPDMRSLIKKVQQLYTRGVKEMTADSLGASFDCSEVFGIIMNPSANPWDNYKALVTNWSTRADDAMLMIGQQFPNYIQTVAPDKMVKLPLVILAIAEYDAQLPNAIDKFVVLLALVFKLQSIMK